MSINSTTVVPLSTEKKQTGEVEAKKAEISVPSKKTQVPVRLRKKSTAGARATSIDLWEEFDDTFTRFRKDFEDLLFPADWSKTFSFVPDVRVPAVDLKDGEKEFVLQAEMPGFKKGDIEIDVQDNAIEITGTAGWKYDERGHLYICKERACKTFYRRIELPEDIKIDEVKADLNDGVLEVTLPKKTPKPRRKVTLR